MRKRGMVTCFQGTLRQPLDKWFYVTFLLANGNTINNEDIKQLKVCFNKEVGLSMTISRKAQ